MKILHIGNIANNAYLAALGDRKNGMQAYVISPEYTHVMGFPFWEHEEIEIDKELHFQGDLLQQKYPCPDWFVYGTWDEIIEVFQKKILKTRNLGKLRGKSNESLPEIIESRLQVENIFKILFKLIRFSIDTLRPFAKKYLSDNINTWIANTYLVKLRKKMNTIFIKDIQNIVNEFDIIVFYGAANSIIGLYNLEIKYFISFEHGTLRDYIWTKYPAASESRKRYSESTCIMVSNQDNYQSAFQLMNQNEERVFRTPHPTTDDNLDQLRDIRLQNVSDLVLNKAILFPARHSYSKDIDIGKGFDQIIDVVESILKYDNKFKFIFVEWGEHLDLTKSILKKKGISNFVEWRPLMSRLLLKRTMAQSLYVVDQFNIPAYGGIVSDSLSVGTTIFSRKRDDLDLMHFGAISPVIGFQNVEDLVRKILAMSIKESDIIIQTKENIEWSDKYLSQNKATEIRNGAYKFLLNQRRNESNE